MSRPDFTANSSFDYLSEGYSRRSSYDATISFSNEATDRINFSFQPNDELSAELQNTVPETLQMLSDSAGKSSSPSFDASERQRETEMHESVGLVKNAVLSVFQEPISRPPSPVVRKPVSLLRSKSVRKEVSNEGLISHLPSQKEGIIAKRGAVFTIMVAGESGLGKTTFVNTLFDDEFDTNKERKLFAEILDRPLESWQKTATIELKEAEYVENNFKGKFTVIDTPGFGDYSNNNNSWAPIVNYIDSQHRMYMLQEEQPDRRELVDTRVHVCLYFIRPNGHGLLSLDIKVMQELCRRVNLIPVIAKADSLTPEDSNRFKQSIRDSILENDIEIYEPPFEETDEYTPDGILDQDDIRHMPFSVMSSEDKVVLENGQAVRGRNYRWGLAEVENPDHCDFVRLRRVLMSRHMLDLIDTTVEKHYEAYRKSTMLLRIRHVQQLAEHGSHPKSDGNKVGEDLAAVAGEAGRITIYGSKISEEGGLDALKCIWPHGKEFLEKQHQSTDAAFLDRQEKCIQQHNLRVHFQEQTFQEWKSDLEMQHAKLETELNMISRDIKRLKEELNAISQEHSSGSSSRQGRYAIKK